MIFECKTSKAEYVSEKNRIIYTFDGYPNIEDHKRMYLKAMEFTKNNRVVSFIMDFRKMKGTFTMLNQWVIDTLRPSVELGLKKGAMILNEDAFTLFSANDAIKKVKLIQIQAFKTTEDAEEWLDEK